MTIPPPPTYAPTVGLPTTWWTIDDPRPQPDTTPDTEQPNTKPDAEPTSEPVTSIDYRAIAATIGEHTRTTLSRPASDRARRFRRWCILTACSGAIGYAMYLPQLIHRTPFAVQCAAWLAAWAFDLRTRQWGSTRVADLTGPWPIAMTTLARIPVASALIALLDIY